MAKASATRKRGAWNKGRAFGAKAPLSEDQVKALRFALTTQGRLRDLALFETHLSTMLRAGDVLGLKVIDVRDGLGQMHDRLTLRMEKTDKAVTAPLTGAAQKALHQHIAAAALSDQHYLFCPLRSPRGDHMTVDGYRLVVKGWCHMIHADPRQFSTHSLRRTRASIIYKRTGNLRAVQLLLGHSNVSATQRYLGIEEADALDLAREVEV